MNQPNPERLYKLIPAIYQLRDAAEGEPLRALLAIIEQELQTVEADIEGLYENWFIETCDEWVVPYIGDLLDVRNLYAQSKRTTGQERRAYIANTLAYRRRKGTASVLEGLAYNITGWRARAVESYKLLSRTTVLNNPRIENAGTVDLRQSRQVESIGTPFEVGRRRTVEIRQIDSKGSKGKYNVPNVALFLWRLQSYPLERVTARIVKAFVKAPTSQDYKRFYSFSPLGYDIPLFNQPQTKTEITDLAQAINVPDMLARGTLAAELEKRRQALVAGELPETGGYFGNQPILKIFLNNQLNPIPPEEILIADLSQWQQENWQYPASKTYPKPDGSQFNTTVAVDPKLGRLVFLTPELPNQVEVSYSYGFSGDIGGGSYDRSDSLVTTPGFQSAEWKVLSAEYKLHDNTNKNSGLSRGQYGQGNALPVPLKTHLAEAVRAWNKLVADWQSCEDKTFIPLGQLIVPGASITQSDAGGSKFTPGIVRGLNVSVIGKSRVVVTPGIAVDSQGRVLKLEIKYWVDLQIYLNKTVLLVICYNQEQGWQIQAISTEAAHRYPPELYIRLARLTVQADGSIGEVQQKNLAPRFTPGIVSGFTVIPKLDTTEAIVTPGIAINSQGEAIILQKQQEVKLESYQEKAVLLAARRSEDSQRDSNAAIDVFAGTDAYGYLDEAYISLTRLEVGAQVQLNKVQYASAKLRPGIIKGLEISTRPLAEEVTITPGKAVDGEGRQMNLEMNYRLNLRLYTREQGLEAESSQTLLLVMGHPSEERNWQFFVIPEAQSSRYPAANYLRLARLVVDEANRIISPPDLRVRPAFNPGIVAQGLKVNIDTKKSQVTVNPGKAVNRHGEVLKLNRDYVVNLALSPPLKEPGRIVTLFINNRKGRAVIDTVPEVDGGIITIADNSTYTKAEITLSIPAGKQLQIVAAEGCRPHLRGNLSVQGTSQENAIPGELILNGLLLEGKLTVLPGNLKRLQISHCTLVPKQGGLMVLQTQPTQSQEEEGDLSLLGLVIYYINFIYQLFTSPTHEVREVFSHPLKFARLILRATRNLFADFWQATCESSFAETPYCSFTPTDGVNPTQQETDNNQLEITIDHSICGAVHLADTVPSLAISDSIIDWGKLRDVQTRRHGDTEMGGRGDGEVLQRISRRQRVATEQRSLLEKLIEYQEIAISAPRAHVSLAATTVFGMTKVFSLEASNTILTEIVLSQRRQIGCLRFCYVPEDSQTPRRYRCQPDIALAKEIKILPKKVTAIVAEVPYLWAATLGDGIFYSPDNGETWTAINQGLTNTQVNALAIHNGQVFAGTNGGYIFQLSIPSSSSGWVPVTQVKTDVNTSSSTNITALVIKPDRQTPIIFAATFSGRVFHSQGRNADWTASMKGLENVIWTINALAINSQGKLFAGTAGNGVFYSLDDSNSWREPSNLGLENKMITALAIDAKNTIFAGTAGDGIFYSRNDGEDWTNAQDTKSLIINCIAVNPTNGDIFAGTTSIGILYSPDNGANWTKITSLVSRNITALTINSQGQILAGTAGGSIWRSSDNGASWTAINQGLNNIEQKLSILNRLQPNFTSNQYGEPGYAQLSLACAQEIRTGAEDGAEMGAFNYLKQPQRENNLLSSLEEYMRFGLEAGIFYIT
jgi:hypothetical protein